jgi:hypothetical protein
LRAGRRALWLSALSWLIAAGCAPLVGLDEDYYVRAGASSGGSVSGSGVGVSGSVSGSGVGVSGGGAAAGAGGGSAPMAGSAGNAAGGSTAGGPSTGLPEVLPEGKLAYHRFIDYSDGDAETFVVDLPSGKRSPELGQLFGLCGVLSPSFSPDGTKLAVAARPLTTPCPVGDPKQNELEIYVLDLTNLDVPSKVRVTENTVPDEDPSFAPSGDFLLAKRAGDITKLSLDPAVLPHTTCQALAPGSYCFAHEGEQLKPVMSSKGLVFYQQGFDGDADIYSFDLATAESGTFAPDALLIRPMVYEARPSVFGDWLYFARWAAKNNPADRVVRRSLNALDQLDAVAAIQYDDASDYTDPSGMTDDLVIFSTDEGGGLHDIFVANFNDGTKRNLDSWLPEPVNSAEDDLSPTFWAAPPK